MRTCWVWLAMALAVGWLAEAREIAEKSGSSFELERTGVDDDVSGRASFRSSGGRSQFRVQIKNGPVSQVVKLKVGGVNIGTFTTGSSGAGKAQFASGRNLNFDPRGRELELEDASHQVFLRSGSGAPGGVTARLDERTNLRPTGVQPAASGHAVLRQKKGIRDFDVEVEDLANGQYELWVGGVLVHTFNVVGGGASLEFSNGGDDPDEMPLTFDPYGRLIQVLRDGVEVLTGTMLAGVPGVNVCTASETRTELSPTVLAPGGSGHADYKVKLNCEINFSVEVEDVPVGAYDLYVADILRGTIQVVVQPDAKVEGEIKFSSRPDDSPSGELPLEFDPAGAWIEVRQGTNVFFTATGGAGTNNSCTIVEVEPDLVNSGLDPDAKGKARFRQETNCRRDFRVEVERLAAGSYELWVGGVLRGVITVSGAGSETEGEIEFDTEATPGKVLLTFDPRGLSVEVRQAGNLYLSVTMPN